MKRLTLIPMALLAVLSGGAIRVAQDACGPFTDVSPAFCPYVLEMYYLGITAGTSSTTYSPDNPVTRGQAAAFVSKSVNQSLARSSRRAPLGQWWTPQGGLALGYTTLPGQANSLAPDGADIWAGGGVYQEVWRVRASDGRLLETWQAPNGADRVLIAMGRVFVTNNAGVGFIDPALAPGAVVPVAEVDGGVNGIAFDGARLWVVNSFGVSWITPAPTTPWTVTEAPAELTNAVEVLFDGTSVWVLDSLDSALVRLDSDGNVTQTIPVGEGPGSPVFDGTNLWVANSSDSSLSVVRTSTGEVVATLTGNGLDHPGTLAFDGQRVLAVNFVGGLVTLWNAAALSPLGSAQMDGLATATCSDGINFWLSLAAGEEFSLGRF